MVELWWPLVCLDPWWNSAGVVPGETLVEWTPLMPGAPLQPLVDPCPVDPWCGLLVRIPGGPLVDPSTLVGPLGWTSGSPLVDPWWTSGGPLVDP